MKLRGLLPSAVSSQELQVKRVMHGIYRKAYDIERYILLSALQDRNEQLFYQVVIQHIEEIMPLIYTPTVGQACKEFSQIFRRSKGFYITPEDKGQIPIGKLALYSACAGIQPHQCLPIMLDVGTNNEEILDDIFYLGYRERRLEGEAYFEIVDEFVQAVQHRYPDALIQFEDFLTPNAYALLNKYKDNILCFNDDIQGTAAVALGGVYASTRITKKAFKDLKIMFLGAGSAATGIADLMVSAFMDEGLKRTEAEQRLWFVDREGMVVKNRTDLLPHNLPYAHNHEQLAFIEAIDTIKPDVLIGATGAFGTFTQEVIEHMSAINEHPVIFALSNPTSKAECTAEQAYTWSKGKAVFASGSPFDNVIYEGREFDPGQGNNAYVFPGIGLGAIAANAKTIPDELFLVAARTLARLVTEENIAKGALYPELSEIRDISLEIAITVAEKIYDLGIGRADKPEDLRKAIADYMFDPSY